MTTRDQEIVTDLCSKVRFFSLEQIAGAWWQEKSDGRGQAWKRLNRLSENGWLTISRVLARPSLCLEKPVLEWQPDDPKPIFSTVSKALRNRWKKSAREVVVFLASRRAKAVFGGKVLGVVKNLCQTTHDLHVAEVYLHYRRKMPEIAQQWVGEDAVALEHEGGKVPDALVRDENGATMRAVEFGGAYAAKRVEAFHQHCEKLALPYEMW